MVILLLQCTSQWMCLSDQAYTFFISETFFLLFSLTYLNLRYWELLSIFCSFSPVLHDRCGVGTVQN
eukprot:c31958_g1_i1 orf=67-267(+)